jgi:hypothetical protein
MLLSGLGLVDGTFTLSSSSRLFRKQQTAQDKEIWWPDPGVER